MSDEVRGQADTPDVAAPEETAPTSERTAPTPARRSGRPPPDAVLSDALIAGPSADPARPQRAALAARRLARRLARYATAVLIPTAAGLAASIPIINSTVKAIHAGWVPAGDDGIIATRGWDVLTSHTPLVGQYSEAGLVIKGQVMHSPGPMLYWALALPAHYGSVASLAATMCLVNVLSVIGCVALARRRGGLLLMLAVALGIALMCQSLPTEAMHDIWNPAAGLFPFLLLIFLGWSLACGDVLLLPLTVLVASYVVETHLMYAAPTGVLLCVGFGGLLLRALARHRRRPTGSPPTRRTWPWALAALAVGAACWTEPAIDEIENSPGNLTMIVRTAEHHGATLGTAVGWHAVVRSVGFGPWWLYVPASEWERKVDVLRIPSTTAVDSTVAILAALALVAIIGALVRRFDLVAAALIGLGLSAAIGLEAASNPASRLLSETLGYTMWWGSELGLWVWLTLAWSLWLGLAALSRAGLRALRRRTGAGRRELLARTQRAAIALAAFAALVGVIAVAEEVAASAKPDSHVYEYRSIRAIGAGLERAIPPGQTVVYHLGPLDLGTQPMEPAIRFLLVRHGDRPLADGSFPRLGPYYEQYNRPFQWIVYLTDGVRHQHDMSLAARVRFDGPWGLETVSAWVRRVAPARAPRTRT
jgi:hypothetical protein